MFSTLAQKSIMLATFELLSANGLNFGQQINGSNALPNDKILAGTILKAFADVKINVAEMTISLCIRAENTVGKGENAVYQDFLVFPRCFPKPPF